MKAYPLHFSEKAPKGTKQGAKSPAALIQGREIGVFLAFSQVSSIVKWIEQDLRRRTLYPAEIRVRIIIIAAKTATQSIVAQNTVLVKRGFKVMV